MGRDLGKPKKTQVSLGMHVGVVARASRFADETNLPTPA